MAFQSFLEKYKSFLTNWSKSASGEGTTETFDYKINTKQELNALQNVSTINDMVQLSNGYYDQVGIGRAIKELYKTPKDYLADFKSYNETLIKKLDNIGSEVADSTINVADTIEKSKSIKGISHKLQLKLSLIKSEFDA
jgi:hypothetical protein